MNAGRFTLLSLLLFSLMLQACGGNSKNKLENYYQAKPYSDNPHPALDCALALQQQSQACPVAKLPLIGMESQAPDSQMIASRLMVSHPWMGDRFMALLEKMPTDMRLMLRAVTAIVIDGEIRPSFYSGKTGAIYIDPAYLWLEVSELETISQEEDYRAGFDDALAFAGLWRYLNEDGTWARSPQDNRTIDDLVFPLSRLLYHELTHANAFLPPDLHTSIPTQDTIAEASNRFSDRNISLLLDQNHPLQSSIMKEIAQVMYMGQTASSQQLSLQAIDIANAFAPDRANDDYAYIQYDDMLFHEDVAMLFEELMSKYHFNIDREIAYTNASDSIYCEDYIIAWGQTGRIGKPGIKEAVRLAAARILPEVNLGAFIDNLPAPVDTATPQDWCEPLRIEAGKMAAKGQMDSVQADPLLLDIRVNKRSPHDI